MRAARALRASQYLFTSLRFAHYAIFTSCTFLSIGAFGIFVIIVTASRRRPLRTVYIERRASYLRVNVANALSAFDIVLGSGGVFRSK